MNISNSRVRSSKARQRSRFEARSTAQEKREDRLRERQQDPAWFHNVFSEENRKAIEEVAEITERQRKSYISKLVGFVLPSATGGGLLAAQSAAIAKGTAVLLGTNEGTAVALAFLAGYMTLGSVSFVASGALKSFLEMQETKKPQEALTAALGSGRRIMPTVPKDIRDTVQELVDLSGKYEHRKPETPERRSFYTSTSAPGF